MLPFENRWYMFDFARLRRMHRGEMICLLDVLKKAGYNGLGMYIEGAFVDPADGGMSRPGSLTRDDIVFLREETEKRDIFLFPMTNVLSHMEHFLIQERYADLPMEKAWGGPCRQIRFEAFEAKEFVMHILHTLLELFGGKYIHIGADESHFEDGSRLPASADYVADICRTLLDEGVTPAIWDDVFWMHPDLAEKLPRETEIFDWNYYGHRPESIRFFHDLGFKKVYPCPCDNSWEGLICHACNSSHLKARADWHVEPEEIEAFFRDGEEQDVAGGFMTHWEDLRGTNIWATLVPLTRAGLYMAGEWRDDRPQQEQVEMTLFGRITPYTAVTELLQHTLCRTMITCRTSICGAVFKAPECRAFLNEATDYRAEGIMDDFRRGIDGATALLAPWRPQSETEDRCKRALELVVAAAGALSALMEVKDHRSRWHEAALCQFSDPTRFTELLTAFRQVIRELFPAYRAAADAFVGATADTGIGQYDLSMQEKALELFRRLEDTVTAHLEDPAMRQVALPAWNEMINGWYFNGITL